MGHQAMEDLRNLEPEWVNPDLYQIGLAVQHGSCPDLWLHLLLKYSSLLHPEAVRCEISDFIPRFIASWDAVLPQVKGYRPELEVGPVWRHSPWEALTTIAETNRWMLQLNALHLLRYRVETVYLAVVADHVKVEGWADYAVGQKLGSEAISPARRAARDLTIQLIRDIVPLSWLTPYERNILVYTAGSAHNLRP